MSDNRSRRQVTDEINNNSKMLNNNWMPSNNVSPSPVKNGNWSFFSNPNFEQSDTKLSVFSKQPEWEEYELFPDRSSNRKLTLLDEISGNISFFRIDPSPSTSSVLNNPINKYSIPSGVNSTPVLETADDNRPIGRIEDNLEANFMDISEACLFFHIDSSPSTSSVLNNPTNKYSIPPGLNFTPVLEIANDNRPIGRIEDNLETNFMDISGAHPFFHIDSSPSTSSVWNNPTNKYSIPPGLNFTPVLETANDNRPIGRIEDNLETNFIDISGAHPFFRIDSSPSTSSVWNNPTNKYSIPPGFISTPVLETANDNRPIGRIEDNLEANFMDISEACPFFHIDSSPSTSVLNNLTNKYSIPPGFISTPVLETANDNRPIGRIEDNLETNFMDISGAHPFFRIDSSPSTSSVWNNPTNKYSIPPGFISTPVLETANDNRPIGRIEDNLETNFMDISGANPFFHIDSSPSTSSVLNNPTNKYSIPPGFISIPVLETANDNRPIGRIEDNLETNFMDISGAHPFFHIDSSPSTSSVLNNPTNKYSIPAGVNSMLVSETANDNRPIGRIENNSEELKICNYCLKNGAPYYIYYTHFVREQIDGKSVITCPALKSQICNYCGATGLEAHSLSHCEQWKMEVRKRELPLHLQNKCVINEFTRTL